MRPLPRLHAVSDASIRTLPDVGARAAAIAAAGSGVALHARDPAATAVELAGLAERLVALARPSEAAVFVNRRADVAGAIGAHGVQLTEREPAPADVRRGFPGLWLGRSVHSRAEAETAIREGADYLMLGSIYQTASHPGGPTLGPAVVREVAALGVPVIAIGGVTVARARELREAGAWGVGVIRALWHADDPAAAALAFLEPWTDQ